MLLNDHWWYLGCLLLYYLMCLMHFTKAEARANDNVCNNMYFQVQKAVIIRTDDSLANGATALKTVHATTLTECERTCCKLKQCSVAVFETSTKNFCYLFDCGFDGSQCEFEQDSNYVTSIKSTKNSKPHGGHEWLTTLKPHMRKQMTTGKTYLGWPRVAKRRAPPRVPGNAQCRYPPDVQFRCLDAAKFPSCVAIYDRCDGVPQCGDSSDELDCPAPAGIAAGSNAGHQRGDSTGRKTPLPVSANSNSLWPNPDQTNQDESKPQRPTSKVSRDPMSSPALVDPANTAGQSDGHNELNILSQGRASELAESYSKVRAAVIGLGVSLSVTLLAIVVLSCRLRQLRARLPRGGLSGKLRNKSVDDEDYLINGMYL